MDALEKLKQLTTKISSYELKRNENLKRLRTLFEKLNLGKKVERFDDLFAFKAINLSGISLQEESLGKLQEGKYLQLLAIAKIEGKSKNISLGYFGRVENASKELRSDIVEFVIRYRFEKSFLTLEHYFHLLEKVESDG